MLISEKFGYVPQIYIGAMVRQAEEYRFSLNAALTTKRAVGRSAAEAEGRTISSMPKIILLNIPFIIPIRRHWNIFLAHMQRSFGKSRNW